MSGIGEAVRVPGSDPRVIGRLPGARAGLARESAVMEIARHVLGEFWSSTGRPSSNRAKSGATASMARLKKASNDTAR